MGEKGCSYDDCGEKHYAKGWCKSHYRQNLDGGPLRPLGTPKRKPRGSVNAQGYHVTHLRGEAVLTHRLVMEKVLERPLLPNENVHHINGVRDDNRPENLELWSTSQPAGQRVADKLAWAREIIALYGEETAA